MVSFDPDVDEAREFLVENPAGTVMAVQNEEPLQESLPASLMRRWKDRPLILIVLATLAIAGVVLWAASASVGPMPPDTVTMSTGLPGSDYELLAKRYQPILAREGIELRLQASNGSGENLERLRDPRSGVSIGFVQGGTTTQEESPGLVSLGALFHEAVWVFYRGFDPTARADWYKGLRFSIGPEGSGTRMLARRLLALYGVDEAEVELLGYRPDEAAQALLDGRVDVMVLVNSWDSPVVQRLIGSEIVEVMSFARAQAFVALLPYLTRLVVPEGVGDMAKNRPPSDVVLVATEASLIVREDLHPAIQYLLLQAATRIHSGPGIFRKAGQYPAAEAIDLPLSENAVHYYKAGPPFLQRYLPLWVYMLVVRALVVLIPLVAVVYPLLRFAPLLYDLQMRRRIYRLYGELKFLETELERRDRAKPVDDLLAQLDRLDHRVSRFKVPLFYSHVLYTLRQHIEIVSHRLERWPHELGQDQLPMQTTGAGGERTVADPQG